MVKATSPMRASPRRSLLFVPGSRPDRFGRALASGADIVCVDLEDAVAPDGKAAARPDAIGFLDASPGTQRLLRINSPRSLDGLHDLMALIAARPCGGGVMLPKVDTADEVRWVAGLFEEARLDLGVAVLIETLTGLENVVPILASHPRLRLAMFGGVDLAAELGVELEDGALLYARSRIVHAAKTAGLDILDVPCLDFRDEGAVQAETMRARTLGFTGKAVLHPSNVPTVNRVFTPTPAEVDQAVRIVAAFEAAGGGVTVLDGKLVERPVVRAMQRIIAAADASPS